MFVVGGRRFSGLATPLVVLALALAGLTILRPAAPASAGTASGNVEVLFAGSLLNLMDRVVGPAFHRATGYSVVGLSGGSTDLANEIKGRTVVADVFVSASPKAAASLMGPANGSWLASYDTFATSTLVLGYNRASRFASALRTTPWYQVVTRPGFLLGRTDPASDPKGVLAVEALDEVAGARSLPALARLATRSSEVFPETTLVGRLQAGQLDAGFFYRVEAAGAGIPTVPLTGTSLAATYTISVVRGARHAAAARAFVRFLLGPAGRALLARNGVAAIVPVTVVTAR